MLAYWIFAKFMRFSKYIVPMELCLLATSAGTYVPAYNMTSLRDFFCNCLKPDIAICRTRQQIISLKETILITQICCIPNYSGCFFLFSSLFLI